MIRIIGMSFVVTVSCLVDWWLLKKTRHLGQMAMGTLMISGITYAVYVTAGDLAAPLIQEHLSLSMTEAERMDEVAMTMGARDALAVAIAVIPAFVMVIVGWWLWFGERPHAAKVLG